MKWKFLFNLEDSTIFGTNDEQFARSYAEAVDTCLVIDCETGTLLAVDDQYRDIPEATRATFYGEEG